MFVDMMAKYPFHNCPKCNTGNEIIETDGEDGDFIVSKGLRICTLFPQNGPGLIEYLYCSNCGYEGPLVWCKKGYSHRILAEAWNNHINPIAAASTVDLVRELEKRDEVEFRNLLVSCNMYQQ